MEKIKTKAYALWNALVTHPVAMTNRKTKEGRDWWGSQFKGTVVSGGWFSQEWEHAECPGLAFSFPFSLRPKPTEWSGVHS